MNMRHITAEFRLSHWAQIMQDRKESGLTIKAYCESRGHHENTYYYWQKKLRDAASGELQSQQSKQGTQSTRSFVEVRLSEPLALPPSEKDRQGQVSIDAAGVRITADSSYPIDSLAALLRMVVCPC